MTRKTYRKLADELGRLLAEDTTANSNTWHYIFAFCNAMKEDNSAFDKERFVEAIHASCNATIKRYDDRALQVLTDSIVGGNG